MFRNKTVMGIVTAIVSPGLLGEAFWVWFSCPPSLGRVLAVLILVSLAVWVFTWFIARFCSTAPAVTFDNAQKALDTLGEWAKWLVALQVSSMGALAIAYQVEFSHLKDAQVMGYGFLTLSFLGLSMYGFTWMLAAIPSIQQRLVDLGPGAATTANDIYAKSIFGNAGSMTLQMVVGWSHFTGIAGYFCFALFLFTGINHPGLDSEKPAILRQEQVEAIRDLAEALKR